MEPTSLLSYSSIFFLILPDDAVDRRKLGVAKASLQLQ